MRKGFICNPEAMIVRLDSLFSLTALVIFCNCFENEFRHGEVVCTVIPQEEVSWFKLAGWPPSARGCPLGTMASFHSPKTYDSKSPVCVNVSVNGCLSALL